MKTIAIFPGSFDPFTIGHADIVRRGLQMFDRIVVAVGYNVAKQTGTPIADRVEAIDRVFASEPRVKVVAYNDLTVDLAAREGAQFLLRGVRSVKDFEYERDMAAVNAHLSTPTLGRENLGRGTSHATPVIGGLAAELPEAPEPLVAPLETVLLIADPRYAHISSSVVRELASYGRDITPYLP